MIRSPRIYIPLIALYAVLVIAALLFVSSSGGGGQTTQRGKERILTHEKESAAAAPTPTVTLPPAHQISLPMHTYQSFNNCGPATLAMYMNFLGFPVTQQELGQRLRPYQNVAGDNDDKSVNLTELAKDAKAQGLHSYYRPGGDIGLMKRLLAADIPVIVRTWLDAGDDIGHYRIVRGYDDTAQQLLQDDSYQGPNRYYSYDDFLKLWEPFQYEYLVIVDSGKVEEVERILGDMVDSRVAWQALYDRSLTEAALAGASYAPLWNQAVASYHLGDYATTTSLYEQVAPQLPANILWYQLEPIEAYAKQGDTRRVFAITDAILNGGNRAYSELYMIRGQIYEDQGNIEAARGEYQRAIMYNVNNSSAQEALNNL